MRKIAPGYLFGTPTSSNAPTHPNKMGKKHHNHSSLEQALEALKSARLKRTKPREAVLRYMVEHHGPFSAGDLQKALKREALDAVTTYRVLAAFEKARLVRRCDFGDGTARFEFTGKTDHHHHHVICSGCRKIEPLDDCHLTKLEGQVKELGYSQVRHVLEFFGLCRACSKKIA